MSPIASLKTRCPVCNKKYLLPAVSAGHKARCSECHTVFRVPLPAETAGMHDTPIASQAPTLSPVPEPAILSAPPGTPSLHPPTEEDIVNWLTQAQEEGESTTPAPRIVREAIPVVPQPGTPGSRASRLPGAEESKPPTPAKSVEPAGLRKIG